MKSQRRYKQNNPPYLRWPSKEGIKLVSFTPHPYEGLMLALKPDESLVLKFHAKNSNGVGWHIRYEVIESKIKFDTMLDIYYENGTPKIKDRVSIYYEDFIGFFAEKQTKNVDRHREQTHFKNELLYENGSSVHRPVEDIVFAAIRKNKTTDELAWSDRDF